MKLFQTIRLFCILMLVVSSIGCTASNQKTEEEMKKDENIGLTIGDKIPEILGLNEDGVEVKASDFTGMKLVLYFYPKDSTPGCTAQACSLRDNYDKLLEDGYAVLGVSADSEASHKKFIAKQKLPFSLIADVDKKLAQAFGVWEEKSFMGKKYMGISRTTFVVDENGVITEIISPKEISTKEHAAQVLELKK